MKYSILFLLALCAWAADLGQVGTVYILPMSGGLDQYLANRLTAGGVVQVVTDPAKADAFFTDRVGGSLDQRLAELFPAPKPEPAKEKTADEKAVEDGWVKPTSQPMSRARGNFFLIDRQTRNVIWSIYERPKSSRPDDLNQAASRIAGRFQKARTGK